MSYEGITWQNQPSTVTPVDADNLNHADTQYTEAVSSMSSEQFSPFVLSGIVATIDGSVANQLDVSSGVIYLASTQDATLRRFAVTSTNFTTSVANTTYYLDIYPVASTSTTDPTYGWSFATSHTGNANYMTIATVTTDSSHNISGVNDQPEARGVVLEAIPRAALETGGMFAMAYNLPAGNSTDAPGNFLAGFVTGAIDYTSSVYAGVTTDFYMRIVGLIQPLYSETYTFYLTTDDGARLYVGDQEIVGDAAWIDQSATTYSGTLALTANKWYPVIIEHYQKSSSERLKFEWQSTSQARQTVPAAQMMWQWPDVGSAVVARYGYFHVNVKIAGNQVWHAGNDGSGSGLDADLYRGATIYIQTGTPSSPNEGDVWIKG